MDRRYPLLNKVMFIGRLVRDCEVKYLESGTQITHFSIAIDGSGNRGTEAAFIDFSKLGDFNVAEYLKKGTQVFVEGHIDQTRKEVDGQKRSFTNFLCDRLQLLSAARSSDESDITATSKEENFDWPEVEFNDPDFDPPNPPKDKMNHAERVLEVLEERYGASADWKRNKITMITSWVKGVTGVGSESLSVEGLKAQLAGIPAYDAQALVTRIYKSKSAESL